MFDDQYRSLRGQGHGGWGGAKFQARLAGWRRELSTLLATSSFPSKGSHVLELGCGNGAVASLFAESGYHVSGVDISNSAIAWAREEFQRRGLNGEFFHADVAEGLTCFEDAKFDVVVDGNCLHCICGEARARAFSGIRRVLVSGGTFILSSMCGQPRSLEQGYEFDAKTKYILHEGKQHRYLPEADDLISEAIRSGFQISTSRVQHNEWWDHLWLIALR